MTNLTELSDEELLLVMGMMIEFYRLLALTIYVDKPEAKKFLETCEKSKTK